MGLEPLGGFGGELPALRLREPALTVIFRRIALYCIGCGDFPPGIQFQLESSIFRRLPLLVIEHSTQRPEPKDEQSQ